eukprot:scaffold83026_cov25-Prasinocladus_malaysianus.AAC.1
MKLFGHSVHTVFLHEQLAHRTAFMQETTQCDAWLLRQGCIDNVFQLDLIGLKKYYLLSSSSSCALCSIHCPVAGEINPESDAFLWNAEIGCVTIHLFTHRGLTRPSMSCKYCGLPCCALSASKAVARGWASVLNSHTCRGEQSA